MSLKKNAQASDPSVLGPRVSQLESTVTTLSDASKQSQTLVNGLSVINSSLDAPADIQINGRTLVSMGSSVLDATKNYVLANKKTILKWADASTTQGIAKFTGKGEKPAIIHVSNFEGKVTGSTVENPHIAKRVGATTALQTPTGTWVEMDNGWLSQIAKQDGTLAAQASGTVSGQIAQELFAFDIIQAIERNVGRIPRADLASKVQWVINNVANLYITWIGNGSGPNGNKATLSIWNGAGWVAIGTNTASSPSSLGWSTNTSPGWIGNNGGYAGVDSNGMAFFLANADASDGVTASTINTDYVSLNIELKQSAILHDPLLPLYEVSSDDYSHILVDWLEADVLNRYPKVQAIQHLQNPYVMAEGENLLPSFDQWTLHSTTTINSPYQITQVSTAGGQDNYVRLSCVPNTAYSFGIDNSSNLFWVVRVYDVNASLLQQLSQTTSFITAATASYMTFTLYSNTAATYVYSSPMLTLGTVAKPFAPRNPSYLFATAKLGQIGTTKDVLYKQDGQWYVRQAIQKDVVLDGSLGWTFYSDKTGFKWFKINSFSDSTNPKSNGNLSKYDGKLLSKTSDGVGTAVSGDSLDWDSGSKLFYISVSDTDTGFGETYTPTASEIQAYFYGWTAKTVDGTGKPTAWSSLGDGTDAPTQTLAYVSTNKAPNFTPYKLSYVLATPTVVTANVEGEVALNGPTQVQVGSGVVVREKVTPVLNSNGDSYIFNHTSYTSSLFKNKVSKLFSVYKNGIADTTVVTSTSSGGYGGLWAYISKTNFDTTAEYKVTYLLYNLDNTFANFTNNGTEFKASYDNSLKSVIDTLSERQADLTSMSSVNVQAIAELYKRVKALGG